MLESSMWKNALLSNGRYQVIERLGEGGMAFVYRAKDHNLDHEVVLKVPRLTMLEDKTFARRFKEEIRSLVRLRHPHIVSIFDVGEHEGVPFAVMQYLSGGTLLDQSQGKSLGFNLAQLASWLPQICDSLDFVHRLGFIHRDVKPENILFDQHGHPFLGDFGIIKVLSSEEQKSQTQTMTQAGFFVGTPEYIAPEVLQAKDFDGRADQYSLGITLFEVLTATRPFEAPTGPAVAIKHIQDPPPLLTTIDPNISDQLARVINKSLSKDPLTRFSDCRRFAEEVIQESLSRSTSKSTTGNEVKKARIGCPDCGSTLVVSSKLIGKTPQCPKCKNRIEIAVDANQTIRANTLEQRLPGSVVSDARQQESTTVQQELASEKSQHQRRASLEKSATVANQGSSVNTAKHANVAEVDGDQSRLNLEKLATQVAQLPIWMKYTAGAILLIGCIVAVVFSGGSSSDQNYTISLGPDEVALLLGLEITDGVSIGNIHSDENGVRIDSIELDDFAGKQLEIDDITLQIDQSDDFTYEIANLDIAELDLHDWENNQRFEAKTISVTSPGKKFLTNLQAAVTATQSTGVLQTSGLSFEKLSIVYAEYQVRTSSGRSEKAKIRNFAISGALPERVDEFSLAKYQVNNVVQIADLRLQDVNRVWAEALVANLGDTTSQNDSEGSESTTTQAKLLDLSKELGQEVVPFGSFSVKSIEINEDWGNKEKSPVWIKDINLKIAKDNGQFTGISGGMSIEIPNAVFPTLHDQTLQDLSNWYFEKSNRDRIIINSKIDVDFNRKTKLETGKLTVSVPGAGTIEATSKTRNIVPFLNWLSAQGSLPEKLPELKEIGGHYQDHGVIDYLARRSDANIRDFETNLKDAITENPHFSVKESRKLVRDINSFKLSPGSIYASVRSNRFVTAEQFFSELSVKSKIVKLTLDFKSN